MRVLLRAAWLVLAWGLMPLAHGAERIVTLAPHLAELVCAAGACDQIVGVSDYTDYPAQLKQLPSVGGAFDLNVEYVLGLDPARVLVWDGGTPEALIARLKDVNLTVQRVRIDKLDDVAGVLEQFGQQFGQPAVADAAAQRYRARLQAQRLAHQGLAPLTVFYQLQAQPIFTVTGQSPVSEAMSICGGVNAFADVSGLAASVSAEAVLARDPQVVIWGKDGSDAAAIAALWRDWRSARATHSGALYPIDADLLSRLTPRMADGVDALCKVIDDARSRESPGAGRRG